MKLIVGIDPGVKTGVAVWAQGELVVVKSGYALEIEEFILRRTRKHDIQVRIEDARQRKWFGSNEEKVQQKKQGAGSVKRDSQRWEEFCKHHNIGFTLIKPKSNKTKLKAPAFKSLTGWVGQTNEHGRDAAMLVFGG